MAETSGSSSPPPSSLDSLIQQYLNHKKSGAHPLGRVKLVRNMITLPGLTRAELVQKLGESETQISEMAKFADFPEPVRETLLAKKVSYRALRDMSRLTPENQTRLADELQSGKTRVQGINRRVEEILKKEEEREAASDKTPSAAPPNGDTPPAGIREAPLPLPKPLERSAPLEPESGSATDALISDTVDEFFKVLHFWNAKLTVGSIVVRWKHYFGKKGWIKTGLKVIVLAFAAYGLWHSAYEVHLHWGRFWFRFKTAAFQSQDANAAPHIYDPHTVARHRLELKWTAVAGAVHYKVYWHTPDDRSIDPLGEDVDTLGAVVDVNPVHKAGYVSVKGIAQGDIESGDSEKIPFETTGENFTDSVDPLPSSEMGGTANGGEPTSRTSPSNGAVGGPSKSRTDGSPTTSGMTNKPAAPAAPAPKVAVPIPAEVHYQLKTPDLIVIRWRAVGPPGLYTYNVYSSARSDMSSPRKENTAPMKLNVATWTPETGLEVYWIVVTAVDAQGNESGYSEAIEVIRHPEKSGPGTMDKAADFIKKMVP